MCPSSPDRDLSSSKCSKRGITLSPDFYSTDATSKYPRADLDDVTVRQARLRRLAQRQPLTSIDRPYPRLPLRSTSKTISESASDHEDLTNDRSYHHQSLHLNIQGNRSQSCRRAGPDVAPPSPQSSLMPGAINLSSFSRTADSNQRSTEGEGSKWAGPNHPASPSSSSATYQTHRLGRAFSAGSHVQDADQPPPSVPYRTQNTSRGGVLGPPISISPNRTTPTPRERLLLAPPPHCLPPGTAYTEDSQSGCGFPIASLSFVDLANQVALLEERIASLNETLSVERVENARAHMNVLSCVASIADWLPDSPARDTAILREGLNRQKAELRQKYNALTAIEISARLTGMNNTANEHRNLPCGSQSCGRSFQSEIAHVPPVIHSENPTSPPSTRPPTSSCHTSRLPLLSPGDRDRVEVNSSALFFPHHQIISHPSPQSSISDSAILDRPLFTRTPLRRPASRSMLGTVEVVHERSHSPIGSSDGTAPIGGRPYDWSRPRLMASTARRIIDEEDERKSEWDVGVTEWIDGGEREKVGLGRGDLRDLLN